MMNAELAGFYNTHGSGEEYAEDQEKLASVENFAKLAAKHGIDLTQMGDQEVDALYSEVYPEFAKMAMEEDEDEDDEDEDKKKESAAMHFQEKVAFQEKFAEADFMGRVMAHSFTQELDNIEKGAGVTQMLRGAEAGGQLSRAGRELAAKATGAGIPTKARAAAMRAGAKGKHVGGKAWAKGKELAGKGYEHVKKHKGAYGAGAGVAAAGGAGYAAGKKKKASADFEEIAANHAIKIAEAAGYDDNQAMQLISSVYNLGLEETEKVSHVQDFDSAIHVRGLEYLEAAGYDVDWSEVFG